jgi:hypothetical protein
MRAELPSQHAPGRLRNMSRDADAASRLAPRHLRSQSRLAAKTASALTTVGSMQRKASGALWE